MVRAEIEIANKLGLHARASAKLTQIAGSYGSEVWLEKGPRRINAKSIMGVMMLAAAKGSTIVIDTDGSDADAAMAALQALIADKFGDPRRTEIVADEIEDIDEWITDEDLLAAVGQQQSSRGSGLRGMDSLTERLAELAAKTTGTPPDATGPDVASSPEPGEHVQQELIAVISKYVSVNPNDIKVSLEKQGNYEVLEVNIVLPEPGAAR